MTIRSYRIEPVMICGQQCDGVWTDGIYSWIGRVQQYTFWGGRTRTVVIPLTTADQAYVPPPANWSALIVESLPLEHGG
jgi:hypothetical protein